MKYKRKTNDVLKKIENSALQRHSYKIKASNRQAENLVKHSSNNGLLLRLY